MDPVSKWIKAPFGIIARPVVNDDDFIPVGALTDHREDGSRQNFRTIVRWYHYGNGCSADGHRKLTLMDSYRMDFSGFR
jgi:hypothetical protein